MELNLYGMDYETLIGIGASALTSTSLLPQLVKLIKEKKSKDVSIVMLLVLMLGLSWWIYYGILKDDFIIIIANAFALLINILNIVYNIRFKDKS
jgi:MtN3 and saliva related transmembrane protein